MEQSLFSFNTYMLTLTAPAGAATTYTETKYIFVQGVTKVVVNYNNLDTSVQPYKVLLQWPGADPVQLNQGFVYDSTTGTTTTISPANSALSYTVVSPLSYSTVTLPSSIKIYYVNGAIQTFNVNINVVSDNIIDMDLNILDIQNTDTAYSTVYNLQSNRDNVVYNIVD